MELPLLGHHSQFRAPAFLTDLCVPPPMNGDGSILRTRSGHGGKWPARMAPAAGLHEESPIFAIVSEFGLHRPKMVEKYQQNQVVNHVINPAEEEKSVALPNSPEPLN